MSSSWPPSSSPQDLFTMGRKTWTTVEQAEFLWDKFPIYMTYVPSKKYRPFWTMLEKEWKDRWPEINTYFTGKKEIELTAAELIVLAHAEDVRLKVLKSELILFSRSECFL